MPNQLARPLPTCLSLGLLASVLAGQDAPAARDVADRLAADARACERDAATARKELLAALARAAKIPALAQRCEEDRLAFETDQLLPASVPAESRSFERSLLRSALKLEAAHADAASRYRALGDTDSAERVESELAELRRRHVPLRVRDLRSQVSLPGSLRAGAWSWEKAVLVNAPEGAAVLRVPPPEPEGFTASYALTLEVARLDGDGELLVAFPRVDAGKRSIGLLAIRAGQARFAVPEEDGRARYSGKNLFAGTASSTFTIQVDAGGSSLMLAGTKVLAIAADSAMTIPDELRAGLGDATSAYVVAPAGTRFQLRRITLLPPEEPAAGAQARPAAAPAPQLLPENSEWKGSWDGSGVQDGECRSIEVIARDANTATVAITTNRGAVFHFELEIKGKALKVTNMTHKKSAGRERLALSDVHGSGSITKDGFSFSFTVRRAQAKRRDNWQGSIKATRAQ